MKFLIIFSLMSTCWDSKPAAFPLPRGLGSLSMKEGEPHLQASLHVVRYTKGNLNLCVFYSTNSALELHREPHLQASLHVVRYTKGNLNLCLFYSTNSALELHRYTNVDWVACRFSA
ncbi:hypothetical protein V2J09_010760 [Rumex salicifolius]